MLITHAYRTIEVEIFWVLVPYRSHC